MDCDTLVIGAGAYGLEIASIFEKKGNVIVVEKDDAAFKRSSLINQSRIHQGYHYPRDTMTALRSRQLYKSFLEKYPDSVVNQFKHYYAIGEIQSHVQATQFEYFCQRIGAPLEKVNHRDNLLGLKRVQSLYQVDEYVFNAHKLKDSMLANLSSKTQILYKHEVLSIFQDGNECITNVLQADNSPRKIRSKRVFNCTYANLNNINQKSSFPLLNLKFELTEICLIEMPSELDNSGLTIMCGPFFSFLPFPSRGDNIYSLTHVRYTPHYRWEGYRTDQSVFNQLPQSAYNKMIKDASRYLPAISKAKYKDSVWEIKAKLMSNENNDGRNILFKKDHGIKNHHCILGSKIDNIFDLREFVLRESL